MIKTRKISMKLRASFVLFYKKIYKIGKSLAILKKRLKKIKLEIKEETVKLVSHSYKQS